MAQWCTVARVDQIPEGEGRAFAVHGRAIAVFNDCGEYRAIDDTCPHAGASLAHGPVTNGIVTCTRHGWRFHLCDGSWADYRKLTIPVYPVRVRDNEIQVNVPDGVP